MSTGPGSKPPSSPGRPAADTPQRLVVRSGEQGDSLVGGANDTAVAIAGRASATMPALDKPISRDSEDLPEAPELIGAMLLGKYLVTEKIGQGGMGAVYKAKHTGIGRFVAIKVLLEKYARREAIVQRLAQEAKLANQAKNEHIIDVVDIGTTDDGRTFVIMELLEGESLSDCLARDHQLSEQRILRIAAQSASALAAAHDNNVVHRDIKPENLFLLKRKDNSDFVKVVDFGISKSLRTSDTGDEEEAPRLTQTGMVLGTPLYMSPEQARGDDSLDHRVDIYALGVIMYEAATGRVPFAGTNYLSVISQVLNEPAQPPRELRPELTEEFENLVLRAMAKDRGERYQSAADLLKDITALLDDPTRSTERAKITGPRRRIKRDSMRILMWIAGIAVTVAAIVVTVVMLMEGDTKEKEKPAGLDGGVAVKTPVVDAAAPPPDAAATITLHVETAPPGARIFRDGEDMCTAPCAIEVVDRDRDVEVRATLDGYDDASAKINPLEHHNDTKKPIHITLKKTPAVPLQHGGTPTQHTVPVHPPGQGSGSGDKPAGSKTGELQGYPGASAGSGKR
jgi:serine/threonine protein kinase